MDNDPLEEALRFAAAPIIQDILEDREQLPHQLSNLAQALVWEAR